MRYRVDDAQFARAVAQLAAVGTAWDARLRRIKAIAEAIQRTQDQPNKAKTKHDKTKHDKTKHDKTKHDKTKE